MDTPEGGMSPCTSGTVQPRGWLRRRCRDAVAESYEIDRDVNKRIKAWGREMAARDDDVLGCSSSDNDNDTEDEEFMASLELALTPRSSS